MRLKDEKFYKTVRDFLDIYLIRHKGYSLNTQKSYREAINLLLLYFKMERGLDQVDVKEIPHCFIELLIFQSHKSASISKELSRCSSGKSVYSVGRR